MAIYHAPGQKIIPCSVPIDPNYHPQRPVQEKTITALTPEHERMRAVCTGSDYVPFSKQFLDKHK